MHPTLISGSPFLAHTIKTEWSQWGMLNSERKFGNDTHIEVCGNDVLLTMRLCSSCERSHRPWCVDYLSSTQKCVSFQIKKNNQFHSMGCHLYGCRALSNFTSITAEQSVLLNTVSDVEIHLEESCKKRINKGLKTTGGGAFALEIGLISTSCGAFVVVLILYGIVRRRNRPTNN